MNSDDILKYLRNAKARKQFNFVVNPADREATIKAGANPNDVISSERVERGKGFMMEKATYAPRIEYGKQHKYAPIPEVFNNARIMDRLYKGIAEAFAVPSRYFRKPGDWRTYNPNWTIWDKWRDGDNWKQLWPYRLVIRLAKVFKTN